MSHKERIQELETSETLRGLTDAIKDEKPSALECEMAQQRLLNSIEQSKKENSLMVLVKAATHKKGFGFVTAASLVVIAAVVAFLIPAGNSAAQAYSEVVQQLREVLVVSFDAEWTTIPGDEPTAVKMAFRKPGLQRIEMERRGAKMVQVLNTVTKEAVVMMPDTHTAFKMNMDKMAPADRERVELVKMLTTTLQELPEKADAIETGETLGNKQLAGFKIGNTVLWVDLETKSLVKLVKQAGTVQMVMSNFQFDPPSLDESKFSTDVPGDYRVTTSQPLQVVASLDEMNLVQYLRLVSSVTKGNNFPSTINPLEILSLQKEGRLDPEKFGNSQAEQQEVMQSFAQAAQGAVMFVNSLRAENDFHYQGGKAVQGETGKAIAWWKKAGEAKYRVIWADLTITDSDTAPVQQ